MSWTATTMKEKRPDGSLVVYISYTDGNRNVKEGFDVQGEIDSDFLAIRAKEKIGWLEAQDASYAAITEGTVTPKDKPRDIPPPPTQDDLDRTAFLTDYGLFVKAQKAVSLGILEAGDAKFTELQKSVQAKFKIEYLNFL